MADQKIQPGQELDINVTGVASLEKRLQQLKTKYQAMLNSTPEEKQTQRYQDTMDKLLTLLDVVKDKIKSADNPEAPEFIQKTMLYKDKLNAFFEKMAVECSDYIEIMKQTKSVLRRGTRARALIFKGHPRGDRRPTTSDPAMQKALDTELEDSGFDARRGNSLFVTTDKEFASRYGNTYLIFPINGFSYTWMPQTKELILGAGHAEEIPDVSEFSDTDLNQAMSAGHEILLKGDFYALRARSLEQRLEQFFKVKFK
jgi:hypothetical protein